MGKRYREKGAFLWNARSVSSYLHFVQIRRKGVQLHRKRYVRCLTWVDWGQCAPSMAGGGPLNGRGWPTNPCNPQIYPSNKNLFVSNKRYEFIRHANIKLK